MAFLMMYIGGVGGFLALVVIIIKRQGKLELRQILRRRQEELEHEVTKPHLPAMKDDAERKRDAERKKEEIEYYHRSLLIAERRGLSDNTYEILRFVCLSVIAGSPIAAFALTDVEISPNSPIGLITKPISTAGTNITKTEWMINIGGSLADSYKAGIQVPVNIFIFGIAGGYLRYLYETAERYIPKISIRERKQSLPAGSESTGKIEITEELRTRDTDYPDPKDVFYESLKDIALFFLSPLLAIAVWLVLLQGGTTSIYSLAAVSFTIGLVTREVIIALIGFTTRILSAARRT